MLIVTQNNLRQGYCKRKVTDAQEVTGVYSFSLILFDVRMGDVGVVRAVLALLSSRETL